MAILSASDIERAVRVLVVAEESSLGVEVSMPVVYPGGDTVTVVVEQSSSGIVVHDSGFAAMRLSQNGISITRSIAVRLAEYAARFNCAFNGGRVTAIGDVESVGVAASLVANASRSVADYALEVKRHAESDFRNLVSDVLREVVGKRLRENEELRGISGRNYRVSAVILDETESDPLRFIASVANRAVVPQNFAMLYDLHGHYQNVENSAVYDETSDIRSEDRLLLQSTAQVFGLMEAKLRFKSIVGPAAGNG
jgi:hypothetical protein